MRAARARSWDELSPRSRRLLVILGIVEVILGVAAQIDISRRPPAQIRGSRRRWRLVSMINFFGPLAYFRYGRRPS